MPMSWTVSTGFLLCLTIKKWVDMFLLGILIVGFINGGWLLIDDWIFEHIN